jgi:hypothetical protein
MPDTPTPGQIAYDVYAAHLLQLAPWGTVDFAQLTAFHKHAWEAAAQAAITAWIASPDWPTPPREETS